MAISKLEILALVKQRLDLPIDVGTHDDLIDLYIEEIGQRICTYINHPVVPDGLKHTWAVMVASALKTEQSVILFPTPDPVEAYEIKLGDTTVKPIKAPVSSSPQVPSIAIKDSIVFDYRSDLNAYRKLRW